MRKCSRVHFGYGTKAARHRHNMERALGETPFSTALRACSYPAYPVESCTAYSGACHTCRSSRCCFITKMAQRHAAHLGHGPLEELSKPRVQFAGQEPKTANAHHSTCMPMPVRKPMHVIIIAARCKQSWKANLGVLWTQHPTRKKAATVKVLRRLRLLLWRQQQALQIQARSGRPVKG